VGTAGIFPEKSSKRIMHRTRKSRLSSIGQSFLARMSISSSATFSLEHWSGGERSPPSAPAKSCGVADWPLILSGFGRVLIPQLFRSSVRDIEFRFFRRSEYPF
jgi:hypothetical protein